MARVGYARVSSRMQDYQSQVDALKAAGCERIFSEKVSGKTTDDRRQFKRLMKDLLPGDTVVVAKLDRLARSSRDLHNILHQLDESGCGFVSLGEAWCDTTSAVGRLMMTIMGVQFASFGLLGEFLAYQGQKQGYVDSLPVRKRVGF